MTTEEKQQSSEDQPGQPTESAAAPDDVKAQLAALSEKLTSKDVELAEVKGALSALSSRAPVEPPRGREAPPAPSSELWKDDPARAYEMDQARRQWHFANNIATVIEDRDARQAKLERSQFDYELRLLRSGNEKVYDKLKPHMDRYLKDNPDDRQPGNAERIFNLIRGEHFDSLQRELLEEAKKEWVPPTGEGGGPGSSKKEKPPELNDLEMKAWRSLGARLGWSPEEYKRRKDNPVLPTDGPPGTYEEWKNRRARLEAAAKKENSNVRK